MQTMRVRGQGRVSWKSPPMFRANPRDLKGVKLHKLSSNESPIGRERGGARAPWPMIALRIWRTIPDGSAAQAAGGDWRGARAESGYHLICGNGSDELLGLLAQAYLQPGDEAIYSEHGFLMYRIAILAAGAKPVVARGNRADRRVSTRILDRVTERTRMVFLANPNNPTGTYLPIAEVRRLHAGLPGHVVLVLDAAYAEYVRRNDYEAGIELVSGAANVVMTRTFSKIHGLAALRIGWCYGPPQIVDAMNRIRGPFNVNAGAIAAGAAAIADRAHVDRAVAHNDEWLGWVAAQLGEIGLQVTPSVGNFVLIHFPRDRGMRAADADAALTARGYILRQVGGYGLPDALRMTIGSPQANRGVVEVLREFMDRSRA